MKPVGRKIINYFPGKIDNHPRKGFVNWWESIKICQKAREKCMVKKEIIEELLYYTEHKNGY